jgi:hypothetical protein
MISATDFHGSLSFNFDSVPSRREGEGWWAEWRCGAGLALQYRNGELSIRQLERLLDAKLPCSSERYLTGTRALALQSHFNDTSKSIVRVEQRESLK